jgi:hypothetical protein
VGKLNPETWAEIGKKWITGVTSSHLSREYGVTRRAITQAAERYGWVRLPEHEIHAATQAKLHGIDYVAAQVTVPGTRAKIIDEAADARAHLIRKHQRDWDALYLIRACTRFAFVAVPAATIPSHRAMTSRRRISSRRRLAHCGRTWSRRLRSSAAADRSNRWACSWR